MSLESPPRLKNDSELGPMLRAADEAAMTPARIAVNGAAVKATIAGGLALGSPLLKITLFVALAVGGGVVAQRHLASDESPASSTPAAVVEPAVVGEAKPAAAEPPAVGEPAVIEPAVVEQVVVEPAVVEPPAAVELPTAAKPAAVAPSADVAAKPPAPAKPAAVAPPAVGAAKPPAAAKPPGVAPPAPTHRPVARPTVIAVTPAPVIAPPRSTVAPSPPAAAVIDPPRAPAPVAMTPARDARTEPLPASALPIQIKLYEAARTAKSQSKFALGLQRLDELVQRFPATPLRADVDLTRAELLMLGDRLGEAATALEALAADPSHSGRRGELLRTLGDVRRKQGDCPRAIDAYARARAQRLSAQETSKVDRGIERCAQTP